MKTETHSIHDVLAKNATSFFIPPFQRAYAWGKPEIERYFSDITRIINSELDTKQKDKLEHFFGTLVIKEEKAGFANKSVIVDGQQRLTTTLIFLIALRDTEEEKDKEEKDKEEKDKEEKDKEEKDKEEKDKIDYIDQNYLTNNSSTFQDKIKLKQVTKDWESYKALVNKTKPNPGVIQKAYEYFKRLLSSKKRVNFEFDHYIKAIQKMNVAVIFLDERPFKGEDPQIIFETLNSLGKPLSLSDLVRNFVLLKMDSEKQSETYENIWHPKIEEVFDDNTSKFFRDYLQYKKATSLKVVNDNNTKELYQRFKDFVDDNFEKPNDFINDIIRYVKCYKWIITETVTDPITSDRDRDKEIKELLRNIFHDITSEAFKPFVLGLLEYNQYTVNEIKLHDETLISTLRSIQIYLVRKRILKLAHGENKNIVPLSKHISELAKGNINMLELLTNMGYTLRLPNDKELRENLVSMNFYNGLSKYSKLILGKIEEYNTKVAVDFRNPKITIEHIMPQKLEDSWRDELGENHDEIKKNLLHNIGNLILTEFNSEIGNKPFEEKKRKLQTSSLHYRLDIIKRNTWNEQSIIEHQTNMINWLLNAFPLPDELKNQSNWNTQRDEKRSIFSPLDSDSGEMAEGNKPIQLIINNNNVIKVKSWREVLIKFLNYLKEDSDFDFDFILDNQLDLFSREGTILKWGGLKDIIDSNSNNSNKYKSFDGKYWNKVKDLNDDLLFIQVNITSSRCVSLIKNWMEKLKFDKDFILIKLR